MNRISKLFSTKNENILNIYFTAGFPGLNNTTEILKILDANGVDMVEIGMPYSDPIADGETIQASNQQALANGMSIALLFDQLRDIRSTGIQLPIILMGYFNPVYQYGVEAFCEKCKEVGIDGLILPDLPLSEYNKHYKQIFEKNELLNIFLITPQTPDDRVRKIDELSSGFIYMVSTASVTGLTVGISNESKQYFQRINEMGLKNPRLIGFGIKDKETFDQACEHASGAIIGSQFVRVLEQEGDLKTNIDAYINTFK